MVGSEVVLVVVVELVVVLVHFLGGAVGVVPDELLGFVEFSTFDELGSGLDGRQLVLSRQERREQVFTEGGVLSSDERVHVRFLSDE